MHRVSGRRIVVLLGFVACLSAGTTWAAEPATGFARWEPAIAAFEKQDAENPPPKNGVLFVGSSSIRLWNLERSFPGRGFINRGFGGSEIADSNHFADRLILKHEPKVVVLYAGDNDLAKMKSPEQVAEDFATFAKAIHARLPKTRILYIAIKPSIRRWNLIDNVRSANAKIAAQCAADDRLEFVDIAAPMLNDEGMPRPELFVKDGLHLSEEGYKLWTELVGQALHLQ